MTFQWPSLLFSLALVPLLLALYVVAQRRRRTYAARFTNLALLQSVVGRGPGLRRHIPPLLLLLSVTALLLSLARPTAVIAVPRDQAAAVLVVDVSGSMEAGDVQPNRLAAARGAARRFIEASPAGLQIALVSFSTTASVRAPLTTDHAAVARAVDGLALERSTAIGDGLNLALDQLAQRPADEQGRRAPGLVVLLSDGESNAGIPPATAAARARDDGVTVHTVGIGQRGASTQLNGRTRVGLDEQTLQAIAGETGGQYFYAAERAELERIYADLGAQTRWVEERTEVTALVSALGTLLLLVGGLLGLRWFGRFP